MFLNAKGSSGYIPRHSGTTRFTLPHGCMQFVVNIGIWRVVDIMPGGGGVMFVLAANVRCMLAVCMLAEECVLVKQL